MDPHAENYYSTSPYAYVANNPIIFIDPDGRDIYIANRTGFLGLRRERLLYEDGNLYKNGEVYEGNLSKFAQRSVDALDKIRTGGADGESLITGLQESSLELTISRSFGGNKFEGKGREMSITWNPNNTTGGPNEEGSNSRPAFIGFSHELGHAEDWSNLPIMDQSEWVTLSNNRIVTNAEKYAMHVENKIRAEHGLPLRTHYTSDQGRLVAPSLRTASRSSAHYYMRRKANIPGNQRNIIPLSSPSIYLPNEY